MQPPRLFPAIVLIGLATLAAWTASAQSLIYGLTDNNSLVRFSATGGDVVPGPALTGLGAGETIVGLDFRPFNGVLHAVSRDGGGLGRLYTADLATGVLTPVALSGPALMLGGSVDIDFNPAAGSGVNALRIVTSDLQNYRLAFTPDGATVNIDGTINVPGGATGTNIFATAYANNRVGLPGGGGVGGTSQYALDSATDTLYRVNPPNNGTLTEAKPLGVDVSAVGGMDIVTGTDRFLAVLTVGGNTGLHEISLATGAATSLRGLPMSVVDLAVPTPTVFPSTLVYGLTDGNSLATFTTDSMAAAEGPAITGLGIGESAVGIDFRPLTGDLYLLTRDLLDQGRLYTVNPETGAATAVTLSGPALTLTGTVDIDFNPAAGAGANALRILTGGGQNYRLAFTQAGATVNVDGSVNVPGGASGTNIIATAYANNRVGLPGAGGVGGTTQYAIDSATDTFYRVNPPNNGTLTEARPMGIDFSGNGGMDIVTGTDRALALLNVGGDVALYEIEITTGATAWIRSLPANFIDLAVPVPVSLGALAMSGDDRELNWTGGVGPFAVQRADVVTDPFCAVAAVATRTVTVGTDGGTGFFKIADLANGAPTRLSLSLSGEAERPNPVTTTASGFGTLEISGNTLTLDIGYDGLSGTATAAHIHGPADSTVAAGVLIDLGPFNGGAFGSSGVLRGTTTVTVEQKAAILSGLTYVNIHTVANGGGEIRGQIAPAVFKTVLSGAAERPNPVSTSAAGHGLFSLVGGELSFHIAYQGLSGAATAAHFHGPADGAGAAGVLIDLAPFNGGAFGTSGSLVGSRTLTPSQLAAFVDGDVYVNIHTAANGGGELRGQVRGAIVGASYSAELTGEAERPTPVAASGNGFAALSLDGDTLAFQITYRGLSGPATAAHIHGPAPASGAAGVLFDLAPFHRGPFGNEGMFVGSVTLLPEQKAALLRGDLYVNIHTAANAGGELRGQVAPVVLQTTLSGAAERPNPVVTGGEGRGYVALIGRQFTLGLRYGLLSGPAQSAHLHGPATVEESAGVLIDLAPFATGGLGVEGYFNGGLRLSDAQVAQVVDGLTYVNIHTAAHTGGEIRGQVLP